MINFILKRIVGTKNERELKRLRPIVDIINSLERSFMKMSDSQLKSMTSRFRERISNGEEIDDIFPEAFAVVREASRRTLQMRPFDVQLIGGIVLHEGKIAEMKTGEGKTLAAALPVYLNALIRKGAHIITVNDYLARRDSEWMGKIYKFLGLSVGVITHDMNDLDRKKAYNSDITYGTNNEFGFDYLRDNMKYSLDDYVQRELNYAIVDEVDSILIDEARTPLIISGPTDESTDKYFKINKIIPLLKNDKDYTVDEKIRNAVLTDDGIQKVENLLNINNLYDPRNIDIVHHVNQALKAHTLFKIDVDYMVKDNEVIIVDEFTGRLMPGRRYSDGLHQALEAKENVKIEKENQTLATITFQNYFRMYKKLAGMTGTADTEAAEFKKIYNLDVVVIPTNMPMIRKDNPDVIYKTEKEKFNAVLSEIKELYNKGQPVLVGTTSIEKSERLSNLLKKHGIPHHVLNAKHHKKEAEIVAQAGRYKAVTISTNMAGRGTDIILGGNPEFLALEKADRDLDSEEYLNSLNEAREECIKERKEVVGSGGLHIIGTERHEARRIDNQLRGRSGRQGDPGSSRFYLSLEDDLLRIFGSERISAIMNKLGMEDNEPIQHSLITKAIENAQKRVESHNFDIRKHLIEYDDVMNKQREVIYGKRREVLKGDHIKEEVEGMVDELVEEVVYVYCDEKISIDEWDLKGLRDAIFKQFSLYINLDGDITKKGEIEDKVIKLAKEAYKEKGKEIGESSMRHLEKVIYLQSLDSIWKDHLLNMDQLKDGIGLRGYGQKDPLQEYQKEGFEMFSEMMYRLREDIMEKLFKVQVTKEEEIPLALPYKEDRFFFNRGDEVDNRRSPVKRDGKKVGRNDPCPCGSGRKYKKCCGV